VLEEEFVPLEIEVAAIHGGSTNCIQQRGAFIPCFASGKAPQGKTNKNNPRAKVNRLDGESCQTVRERRFRHE
jgi:hypothetical protein